LERLLEVVGDISPSGLVEAFLSRRMRIESMRAESKVVATQHEALRGRACQILHATPSTRILEHPLPRV
jgi:hypothetical protein